MKVQISGKAILVLALMESAVVILIIIVFSMKTTTYEQGEEIDDNGNLITVNRTERIDPGTATMDGDYFNIYLKYIVPDGPLVGTQPELFRVVDGDGNLIPIEVVSKNWDDLVWTNKTGVKDYDGLLYLARVESPDSDELVYRVRLRE